jgi:hypothetical protein
MDWETVAGLLPFFLLAIPFSWGNYLLAIKSNRSGALYSVLTFVPGIGFGVSAYLIYSCIILVLDHQPGADTARRSKPPRPPAASRS